MQTLAKKTTLKRKNGIQRTIERKEKSFHELSNKQIQMKYVSLRMLSDSDVKYYQKESGLIKNLQQENNFLRDQNNNLKLRNHQVTQENRFLKQKLHQYSKNHLKNQQDKSQTQAALKQLQIKIEELSDADYTSTYDQIEENDLNIDAQQIQRLKQKMKFLQETLKNSDRIIIKLKDQNERIRNQYKQKMRIIKQKFEEHSLKTKGSTKYNEKPVQKSLSRRYSQKYFVNSIQQKAQQGDDLFLINQLTFVKSTNFKPKYNYFYNLNILL